METFFGWGRGGSFLWRAWIWKNGDAIARLGLDGIKIRQQARWLNLQFDKLLLQLESIHTGLMCLVNLANLTQSMDLTSLTQLIELTEFE